MHAAVSSDDDDDEKVFYIHYRYKTVMLLVVAGDVYKDLNYCYLFIPGIVLPTIVKLDS